MTSDDHRPPASDDPGLREALAEVARGLAALDGGRETVGAAVPSGRRPLVDLFPLAAPSAAAPRIERRHWDVGSRHGDEAPYRAFFGLAADPFRQAPDPRFFFRSAGHDRAAQSLLDGIRRRHGLALLIGEPGVGKTTLCRALVEELDRRTLVSHAIEPEGSIEPLLRTALVDFGVVSPADAAAGRLAQAAPSELAAALKKFAATLEPLGAFAVVIVDEAQRLSVDALERLRQLAVGDSGRGPLQILLAGTPLLAARLDDPALAALAASLTLRCRLDPLPGEEVGEYIAHRLAVAGDATRRIEFTAGAVRRIHARTGGVPRSINALCDRALARAAAAGSGRIDRPGVARAAADVARQSGRAGLRRDTMLLTLVVLALAIVAAAVFLLLR